MSTKNLTIGHWNVGGFGNHCWDTSAVTLIAQKVDVLLLSDTKTSVNTLPLPDKFKAYYPDRASGYQLVVLAREGNIAHDKITRGCSGRLVWLHFDLSVGAGKKRNHRIVFTYGSPKEDVTDELTNVRDTVFSLPKGIQFLHFIGDNNNKAADIKEILPGGYEFLLHEDWITHENSPGREDSQIDHIFTKPSKKSFNPDLHVRAHKPFNPYDYVKKRGTHRGENYSITLDEGGATVWLEVEGEKVPAHATAQPAPKTFHKVLLLKIGNELHLKKGKNCHGDRLCNVCQEFALEVTPKD